MSTTFHDPFRHSWQGTPPDFSASEALIREAIQELRPTWIDLHVDLCVCNPQTLMETTIARFIPAVGERIGMPQETPWQCTRFRSDPPLPGMRVGSEGGGAPPSVTAFFQFAERCALSGYCLEAQQAVSLQVFARALFVPYWIAAFCQERFAARYAIASIGFRGPHGTAFRFLLDDE